MILICEAAKRNEVIGNKVKELKDCKSPWDYKAVETMGSPAGCGFRGYFIIPGTFDEWKAMYTLQEKYGIYQSVGDTTGPGGC